MPDGSESQPVPVLAAAHSARRLPRRCAASTLIVRLLFGFFCSLPGCMSTSRATREAADLVAARQLTLQGLDAVEQNNWEAAENLFREAVAASPHDERAHLQYAKALWHRGERGEALEHMTEAVRLSGEAPELLVESGRMQLAIGDGDAARRSGLRAARAHPQFAAAHALVGDVLARHGRLDGALESYHLSLSLDPRQPEVTLAVAEVYRTWDEPRRILSTLQSISVDSLPPHLAGRMLFLRGVAESQLGREDDAVRNLAQAAQRIPSAEVFFELASAHQKAGDIGSAKLALESGLQCDPAHAASRTLLTQLNSIPRLAIQPPAGSKSPR